MKIINYSINFACIVASPSDTYVDGLRMSSSPSTYLFSNTLLSNRSILRF